MESRCVAALVLQRNLKRRTEFRGVVRGSIRGPCRNELQARFTVNLYENVDLWPPLARRGLRFQVLTRQSHPCEEKKLRDSLSSSRQRNDH